MLRCPYLSKTEVPTTPESVVEFTKYRPTSPPDFRSQYLENLEKKKREEEEQDIQQREDERQRLMMELERPAYDRLFGQRVHSWVLLLPNPHEIESSKNTLDVTEPIFIEPSTAVTYSPRDPETANHYLGIESLWNHENYWINMQNCTEACAKLKWDLSDVQMWEHLLAGEPEYMRKVDEDEDAELDQEFINRRNFHMNMPATYLDPIEIPYKDYEQRYPGGKKIISYKKHIVELFAPYSRVNGIVRTITNYEDYDYTEPIYVYEKYLHRGDKLDRSEKDLTKEICTDFYDKERPDACKSHSYFVGGKDTADEDRTLEFHDDKRLDEIMNIRMHPLFMNVQFSDKRPDHLNSQYVEYSPYADGNVENDIHYRPITKIVQKFHRNEKLSPGKDIAMREFDLIGNEICLTYHFRPGEYTQAKRFFTKPPVTERGEYLNYLPEMTRFYDPDAMASPENFEDLIDLLEVQLAEEEASIVEARNCETMIMNFLQTRSQEYLKPSMEISRFDPIRNEEARAQLIELEQEKMAKTQREVESEIDYLSPYIARLGNIKYLTKSQALQIKNDCINDFKHVLVSRANRVLKQFEKTSHSLEKVQTKLSHAEGLSKEEKEIYMEKANKMNLKLRSLDVQLNRIRASIPKKYSYILEFLQKNPHLTILYEHEPEPENKD